MKQKLGVNIDVQLHQKLQYLVNLMINIKKSFPHIDTESMPLHGRTTKGEIVQEILSIGIKDAQEKLFELFKDNPHEIQNLIYKEQYINEITLPPEEDYAKAMIEVLKECPDQSSTSKEMYDLLAKYFNLSDIQLNAVMSDDRNWHENRSQWARNTLIKNGTLDKKAPRGVWRLN